MDTLDSPTPILCLDLETARQDALILREIGAWVFDEAHCLSKWGHDFRPDYLYVSRLVKQRYRDGATIPLFCFTATAKPDVVADIRAHFQSQLGLTLELLEGGVSRDNLAYEVRAVPTAAKYGEVLELLREALREEGGAIVFCARRKTAEDLAQFLTQAGIDCGHFHGDLSREEKRATQEAFLAGQRRVIAATNAFGMGVDKPDVRLVIHLDTPGSLENYLQEAGRAGRDQAPARCVLLYDEADLDVQFRLLKGSRLTQHDIHAILKALRHIERKDRGAGEVVVTSGEILLEIPEEHRIDPDASDADTKVRIAVAWLEQARLLERHENHTRVLPGSLRVKDLDEARMRLRKRLGPGIDSTPYLRILEQLIQADDDQSISTDTLMLATGKDSRTLRAMLRELDQWGKTRVIVHRVAWLLREAMVLPQAIMVLAYNRSAALEIRRRLWALVGADTAGVRVLTLHGLAMRLTGTSYAVAIECGETPDFDAVIRQASAYLSRAEDDDGVLLARDRALAGLRFLLVDEYQDINGDHYDLISALAGRTLQTEEDRLALFAVGDDDQNIYAFDGANARYIRRFEADYQAVRHQLVENYRSTAHIIQCANQVIAPARGRMKTEQAISIDQARRDQPAGGLYATLDPVAGGRVQLLEVPSDPRLEAQLALAELQRLSALAHPEGGAWGRCAVIARRWTDLEPLAALCRLRGIPVRLLRDDQQPSLHTTREGRALLDLLEGSKRRAGKRLLVRAGALSRWLRRRYGTPVDGLIEHPFRAAVARFIRETEAAAPSGAQVASELVESVYETGTGARSFGDGQPNGPLVLMTAHRAKGLEFDHVLILDAGGWTGCTDDERRLYYVAMTRARQTLTLCESRGGQHPFTPDTAGLALRTRPTAPSPEPGLDHRTWCADPSQVVLSWPGYFAPSAPIHPALAALDVGSPLGLRERADGRPGWELTDPSGIAVTRMAGRFRPPAGRILKVRVLAVLVRDAKEEAGLRCQHWELVLPEIEYDPVG